MNLTVNDLHLALWAVLILHGTLVLALHRRLLEVRYLLRTIDVPQEQRLPAGIAAPDFEAILSRSGRRVTVQTFRGRLAALVFLSPKCSSCGALIESLRSAPYDDRFTLLWSGGDHPVPDVGQFEIAVPARTSIASLYRITGFPTAVVIDGRGLVLKYAHPSTYEQLIALVSADKPTDLFGQRIRADVEWHGRELHGETAASAIAQPETFHG